MKQKWFLGLAVIALFAARGGLAAGDATMGSLYDIGVKTIDGEDTTLAPYKGKVMLIVNTASKCGFTGQYKGLESLYETYGKDGLVVLGFPCNDFGGQEPGTNEEIQQFCSTKFNVTFPMFDKLKVKGEGQHPLYTFLTSKETNPEHASNISWNFNKFLVGRDGTILGYYGSRVKPESDELVGAIKAALGQP